MLNWFLDDEQTLASDELFESVAGKGAVVPSLWRLEIAHALQVAVRRNRIDLICRDATIQKLQRLPIEIDQETDTNAWTATLRLSDRYRLAVYDAAYLELALRRSLPLASRDRDLVKAAVECGVAILPAD
jgi:predicted nucleic acid-binding protein